MCFFVVVFFVVFFVFFCSFLNRSRICLCPPGMFESRLIVGTDFIVLNVPLVGANLHFLRNFIDKPEHDKTCWTTCSDQHMHPPCLTNAFAWRSMGSKGHEACSSGQRRLWSGCAGWSEHLLDAHNILLFFSCSGLLSIFSSQRAVYFTNKRVSFFFFFFRFRYAVIVLFDVSISKQFLVILLSMPIVVCFHAPPIWAMSLQNLILPYANNKDADQPAHPRSLSASLLFAA